MHEEDSRPERQRAKKFWVLVFLGGLHGLTRFLVEGFCMGSLKFWGVHSAVERSKTAPRSGLWYWYVLVKGNYRWGVSGFFGGLL